MSSDTGTEVGKEACRRSGVVTRSEGSVFWVEAGAEEPGGEAGREARVGRAPEEIPCVLRGRLKKRQLRFNNVVVVGDEVAFTRLPDGGGVVEEVFPRRSELARQVTFRGVPHIVAANLDQLVIVQAARQPDFKRALAERFLATARYGRMEAVLVVNKCDLEDERVIRSWTAPLEAVGVRTVLTSAVDGRGVEELRSLIAGRLSALAGQSGVGKSSLVNAMYPEYDPRVSAISEWRNKGRHATRSSRLYRLPEGGYLADTPGVRELGLFEDSLGELGAVFPEIEALAAGCKFRDCTHTHEPRCAVKEAVERGEIDRGRYDNYVRLRRRD